MTATTKKKRDRSTIVVLIGVFRLVKAILERAVDPRLRATILAGRGHTRVM